MQHDARRKGAVFGAVSLERAVQQCEGVVFLQVWLPVVFRDDGCAAAQDDAVAEFVEDLGGAGHQARVVERLVETNADVTGGELRRIADDAPRRAPRLVVKRGVDVPRARRPVLQLPDLLLLPFLP